MNNPLLEDWDGPFALPPFDRISDKDFDGAISTALDDARANIAGITASKDEPDFANTIEALELADRKLGQVLGVFFNIAGADSNEARRDMQKKWSPKLAAFGSEITMNAALFARIEAVWQKRDDLDLTPEQARVLMLTRRGFVRSGALLEGDNRARLADILQSQAILTTQFGQNLLTDERTWFMEISGKQLDGLPGFVRDAAAAAATDRGIDGHVITTSRSLITPFLQFSPHRDLRKKAFEAWTSRGANGGETDNREIAADILKLRAERAKLLGYENFARFRLETEMAGTPEAVRDLLTTVWTPALAAAKKDAAVLEQMLRADGYIGPLEPWDWRYYAEKRRKSEHDLDEAELKPYFQLDRMISAVFSCANRLFGLEFRELDVPMYHADVRVWEVTRNGRHLGVFLGDYFARASKRSGAWCSTMRSQQKLAGDIRPIVVNVCNFAKPKEGAPALLSFDDARTLFHEFGHALHQLLSDVTFESISGTSVSRDFVELPSQVFEHWLELPEVLGEFATHAETGEPLPQETLDRLLGAQTFDKGYQTVEFISSALVDLEFHDGDAPVDPMQKQAEVLERIGMPNAITLRHAAPHFGHIFSSDGYSSAYYSYMWSEVMDADAFEAFKETGDPFDSETARRLEEHVLSKGGSDDGDVLYKKFRGRMPSVDALLAGRGLA